MLITCFIDTLEPGGLQRHVLAVAKELLRRGHRFAVVSARDGALRARMCSEGIAVGLMPELDRGNGVAADFVAPDCGLIVNAASSAFYACFSGGRMPSGLPPVLELWPRGWMAEISAWHVASGIIASNASVLRDAVNANPEIGKIAFLLDNPVTINGASSAGPRRAWRRAHGVAEDDFLIGSLGRYVSVKRFARLIVEAEEFLGRVPAAKLAIAGDKSPGHASTYDTCCSVVDDLGLDSRVLLLDYDDDPQAMLAALDVYVSVSSSEGQSIAVSEALWTGVPVVATAVPGTAAQVVPGETGVLMPVWGPSGLSEILYELWVNPPYRASLAASARAHARKSYGLGRYVDGFETAMKLALESPPVINARRPRSLGRNVLFVTYDDVHRYSPRLRAHWMQHCLEAAGLNARAVHVADLSSRDVAWADVVVFHRIAQALLDTLPGSRERIDLARRLRYLWEQSVRAKPTGYDMDDFLFVAGSEPSSIVEDNEHFLATASFVVANNGAAAARFRALNDHVFVVPNPVDESLWNAGLHRRYTGTCVFGWIAGSTHATDEAFAAEVIAAVLRQEPGTRAVVVGAEEMLLEPDVAPRCARLPTMPWYRVPYAQSQFSVNLVPLAVTEENNCKGQGHITEPAFFGIPSIAQRTESYSEAICDAVDGLLASDVVEWCSAARALRDDGVRRRMGVAARERALRENCPLAVGRRYADAIDALLGC